MTLLFAFFFAGCSLAGAQPVELRGAQDGTYEAADYVVDSGIVVEAGTTLNLQAGARLFFGPYAGIEVRGSLVAEGRDSLPIIFSSFGSLDNSLEPAPFDWTGIIVHPESPRLQLEHTSVEYSATGINCMDTTTNITLHAVRFMGNGTDFIRDGTRLPAGNDKPFSYKSHPVDTAGMHTRDTLILHDSLTMDSTAAYQAPLKASQPNPGRVIRILSTVITAGGAALVAGGNLALRDANRRLDSVNRELLTTSDVDRIGELNRQTERIKDDQQTALKMQTAGWISGGCGLVGFTVSFFF